VSHCIFRVAHHDPRRNARFTDSSTNRKMRARVAVSVFKKYTFYIIGTTQFYFFAGRLSRGYGSGEGEPKGVRETAAMAAATRHKFHRAQIRTRATTDRIDEKIKNKRSNDLYNIIHDGIII